MTVNLLEVFKRTELVQNETVVKLRYRQKNVDSAKRMRSEKSVRELRTVVVLQFITF
jgi:head-tail adaptor